MIKRVLSLLLILSLVTGCAGQRAPTTANDVSIATQQATSKNACYGALKELKPDMSDWSADKITAYQAMEKLGEANKLLAKQPLDPCANAGGTNVYDAEIAVAHEGTEQSKYWLSFGESLATKVMYAWIATEAFDWMKTMGGGSTTGDTINLNNTGDGSFALTNSLNNTSVSSLTTANMVGGSGATSFTPSVQLPLTSTITP